MDDSIPGPASPAEFLRKELERRRLTQRDVAFIIGTTDQAVNQLVLGKRGISADMAVILGAAFGVTAEYLLRLQKSVEVSAELARAVPADPSVVRKAMLMTSYPVREMVKRGWLTADQNSLETQMAQFFGVSSMDETPALLHHAKKTNYDGEIPTSQLAWLFRVRQIAGRLVVPKYSEKALREALGKLRLLLNSPDEVGRIPRILSECGVRLVVVESLPGAKIDGVCFWLDGGTSPVVGMSVQRDRIDNFWFVLRHEIEHVLRQHGVSGIMIDADLDENGAGADLPEEELQANSAASDFCVPKAKMDSWIARKSPFFSRADLLGFAKILQIHPGIVAGQLRNRTKNYRIFTDFLVKIRSALTATAVVDGWGESYPI